jgi:hypothetical protein
MSTCVSACMHDIHVCVCVSVWVCVWVCLRVCVCVCVCVIKLNMHWHGKQQPVAWAPPLLLRPWSIMRTRHVESMRHVSRLRCQSICVRMISVCMCVCVCVCVCVRVQLSAVWYQRRVSSGQTEVNAESNQVKQRSTQSQICVRHAQLTCDDLYVCVRVTCMHMHNIHAEMPENVKRGGNDQPGYDIPQSNNVWEKLPISSCSLQTGCKQDVASYLKVCPTSVLA